MTTSTSTRYRSIKALIFDCDGTLVDSEPLGIAALIAEAAPYGFTMPMHTAMHSLKGKKMAVCVQLIQEQISEQLPEDFIPKVRTRTADLFSTHLTEIKGAGEFLASLQLPYCIASNGPIEKMQHALEVTGLNKITSCPLVSAYEVNSWKPEPQLFLHAANLLGYEPSACAVVEDSEAGIPAGIAAGMKVFALRQQDQLEATYANEQVQFVSDFSEISTLINPPTQQ